MLLQLPKCTKQRIATAVAPNAKSLFLLLLANARHQRMAGEEYPCQKRELPPFRCMALFAFAIP